MGCPRLQLVGGREQEALEVGGALCVELARVERRRAPRGRQVVALELVPDQLRDLASRAALRHGDGHEVGRRAGRERVQGRAVAHVALSACSCPA